MLFLYINTQLIINRYNNGLSRKDDTAGGCIGHR